MRLTWCCCCWVCASCSQIRQEAEIWKLNFSEFHENKYPGRRKGEKKKTKHLRLWCWPWESAVRAQLLLGRGKSAWGGNLHEGNFINAGARQVHLRGCAVGRDHDFLEGFQAVITGENDREAVKLQLCWWWLLDRISCFVSCFCWINSKKLWGEEATCCVRWVTVWAGIKPASSRRMGFCSEHGCVSGELCKCGIPNRLERTLQS